MNGFEPLRRRIIDYTEAGQWSEVYDGPLEDCESEKLKAENAKLVMKLNAEHLVRQNVERENAKLRELVRDMHKALFSLNLDHCQACPREDTCVFIHECAFERDMRELGVEVDA